MGLLPTSCDPVASPGVPTTASRVVRLNRPASLATIVSDPTPTPPAGSAVEVHRLRSSLKSALFGRAPEAMRVDRFVVLDQLGSGGMGVVYGAYDPQLDRKIALKLLKQEHGAEAERARSRLLREAQAMARLSHPNVVQVYQAGVFEGRVFLAMEYVRGCTLRQWQQDAQRSWREIVDKYIEAARGLSAAHEAGLVHRDFKPANVLVEDGGRVRVTDFGTARSGSIDPEPATHHGDATDLTMTAPDDVRTTEGTKLTRTIPTKSRETADSVAPAWSDRMTKTGSLVGTPAYMSPEQHAGGTLDARSDQFSFCIALHEALFGELPFSGNTRATVAANVLAGDVRSPPSGHGVPMRIVRAIRRGLSRDPADRFASMDDLVGVLRDKSKQVRSLVVGSALVVSAAAWIPTMFAAGPVCVEDADAFVGVWDETARERLAAHFASSPVGTALWTTVAANLDHYVDAWQDASVSACQATHVEHRQSESSLDLRMWCLDQRRAAVGAHVDALFEMTSFDPDRLVDARSRLPELATCSNVDLLTDGHRPPANEAERKQVEQVRASVLRAGARLVLPRGDLPAEKLGETVLAEAHAAKSAAEAIGYTPLVAEARYVLGRALRAFGTPVDAKAELDEAARLALASRHTSLVVSARHELAYVLARDFSESDFARHVLADALAHLERYDARGELQARALLTKTMLDTQAGDLDGARTAVDEALELARAEPEEWRSAALQAMSLQAMANLHDASGDGRVALKTAQKALALGESTWGRDDLQTAKIRLNVALFAMQSGQHDLARSEFVQVDTAYRRYYAESSAEIGNLMTLRAELALSLGELDDARRFGETAVRNADARLESTNPGRADPRWSLALIAVESSDFETASEVLEELAGLVDPPSMDPDDEIAYQTLVVRAATGSGYVSNLQVVHRVDELLALESIDPTLAAESLVAVAQWSLARGEAAPAVARLHAAQTRLAVVPTPVSPQLRAVIELVLAHAHLARGETNACVEQVRSATERLRALPRLRARQIAGTGPDENACSAVIDSSYARVDRPSAVPP